MPATSCADNFKGTGRTSVRPSNGSRVQREGLWEWCPWPVEWVCAGMQSAAAPAAEGYGGGISAPDAAHLKFSKKDVQVDWDKVSRVAPLVDQALGARSEEPAVVANARKLEKFYPHLVRWDVTRSKSVRSLRRVCVRVGVCEISAACCSAYRSANRARARPAVYVCASPRPSNYTKPKS